MHHFISFMLAPIMSVMMYLLVRTSVCVMEHVLLLHVASKVVTMKQCSGKIVVKSKNSLYKLIIPYQASVLHGLV